MMLAPGGAVYARQTTGCDPTSSNPIVCENQNTGNPPSEWDISGAGDSTIQGFATDISVAPGQTISFKIKTNSSNYILDIYRMGYYGGMGARKVATISPSAALPQSQPACLTDSTTGLIDCGNWAVSASWGVPATAVSGIYFARATRIDTGGASHIFFIVRDDAGRSDVLFQTSDTTWQAYNQYGGNSLYVGGPGTNPSRAYKVSYNRPITTRGTTPEDFVFNAEYPMVRWLEANGYNVSYTTGVDADRRGAEILEHKVYLSVGHDEYWSGAQRANVEAARGAGVHLAFFSGNEIFWKTRWENSISTGAAAYRTLVCYKETHANAKIDPLANVWTGTWRDPRFSPPADGGRPENAVSGNIFMVNDSGQPYSITVPGSFGSLRFWRNTSVAQLNSGQTATLPLGTLGYEWDEDLDNGSRPPGVIRLSSTTLSVPSLLQDYGSTYGSGSATHSLTLYRHSSGALVFGAGTIQWPWGLDSNHDRGSAAPSPAMQQATVNLLADMGVQPLTLQSGLVAASQSLDTLKPSSTITSPANNATVAANSTVTISGTATDAGGGVVAGVEVSTDGGTTWHPATGRSTWTYSWQTGGNKTVTLLSRATDDSGNLEQASSGVSVTVGTGTVSCPCSIWASTQLPAVASDPDASAVEVGTRFRSDQNGYITAIRFYKGSQNTGTHVGNLWTATGTRLATITFGSESASGWQQATLGSPVAITANTTYVVSYHTNSGHYAFDQGYFATSGFDNGPLHALRDGLDGPNGVYLYGASAFPTQTFQSSNYWVDVVFTTSIAADTTPPTVTSTSPANGATGVPVSGAVTATFSEDVSSASVSSSTFQLRDSANTLVPAAVSYDSGTRTASLTPAAALAYSSSYTARLVGGTNGIKDTSGNALAADVTWSFTTAGPPPPPPSEGPGGPILIISSTANPFSRYYVEILRAEGLNEFTAMDVSQVSSTVLAGYDVVILGDMTLTSAQVTMLTDWVNAGGNLIAMRPDKKLAGLLGLTDAASTLADGYILVNTASAPGAGIVGETIQYHGTADRYSLSGATSVATLYSNATTATSSPAVTLRSVGTSGGQAAAFTYDLARSVVYTRQGNPAWSGQERDGNAPIRSDDLYFGGAQADWVNLSKVKIPQADEQQRLLANLIGLVARDRTLLPRFWYFPRGLKAVVVMTGDDHGNNGTQGRFDSYLADSPSGCRVDQWECVRSTSYIYPSTPITNAKASSYVQQGFEIGVHVTTNCLDFTPSSLENTYSGDLSAFASAFPSLPAPKTNRTHCIPWSDYDTQPQVELAHGIRFDTNYYYWPSTWINNRPGMFTGSGIPMRFAKLDGTIIDVYQATTQMTDESGQTYPLNIDTLLDGALGSTGYYGVFTANMHTDQATSAGSDAIVSSAQSRGVPIVSSKQMLDWLDGRNGSSFSGIAWNGTTLTFSISAGAGATGLEAMVPASNGAAGVVGVTRSGTSLQYRLETIKGVSYAIFSAAAGSYQITYGTDTTPPVMTGLTATPSTTSATITWSTNEAADSRVDYGIAPDALTSTTSSAALSTSHSLTLSGLTASTTYYYRAHSADNAGNEAFAPALTSPPATFTTSAPPTCPCSIWAPTATPAVANTQDTAAVELGVKFRSSTDGFITALRFYKGSQNTGVHVGNLWSASGTLLASAQFASETASGWQQVTLSNPVAITAGTTYIASYHTTVGFYSSDGAYFQSSGVINGPLEALSNIAAGGNGVYHYGASAFPTDTFNSTNYWVDVVFTTTPTTTPQVSIADVTVTEGNTGTTNAVFPVTLSAAATQDVVMSYATSNGTATAGSDYTATSGQLTIPAGSTSGSITVPVIGDTVQEPNETFLVTLSGVTGATVARGQATGTIRDDDTPLPSLSVADITRLEGNTGTANAVFTVTLSAASTQAVTVTYATADGTAVAPGDYTATSGTLTIPAGSTSGQILVPVVGDTSDEPNETFLLNLSNPTNATIADGQAVCTITDNDNPPSITINNASVTEGNTGASNTAVFTVTLSSVSGFPVTVNYATSDGTATAGVDYNATSGTLSIPAGVRTGQISVTTIGDVLDESNETFNVNLSGATNATISDGLGVGTITDDDAAPRLTINDVSIPEPVSGTANAVFTVTLSAVSARTATVNYATQNGTATAGADYTATSGTLTFPPGTTSAQITVPVLPDTLDETNETFNVNLSGASAATIADSRGVGTIVDDDPPPTVSINDVTVTESTGGNTVATFTVSLSTASGRSLSVGWITANGTAVSPGDYTAASGTLTFAAGVVSRTISITIVGDAVPEPDETFFVNLRNASNVTIADGQGVCTILNDD